MNPLVQYIRDHSQPLKPIPTGESPRLAKLDGIRAVVFDIYGTLIISAAGDISLAEEAGRDESIRAAVKSAGIDPGTAISDLSQFYHDLIRRAQAARREEAGIEFPEVEIREVWRDLLGGTAGLSCRDSEKPETIERVAVAYECAVNPVWPMPGLAKTLQLLKERDVQLGIVSNAQFYTPLMFPAFLDQDLAGLGFSEHLQVYSYREREAKPSRRLYEILAENLAAVGISSGEALYVGNDRLKDIWPARRAGFRTALFAGDQRSLRRRDDDPRLGGVSPDLVITGLDQIPYCLS